MISPKRILSGVQSSGRLHLGNYYGAIREFVRLQDEGEGLYFIANLHALNSTRDPQESRRLTLETACAFLALGLDPEKAVLFRQSDIPEVSELFWILGTVVPVADLRSAHSFKDKVAKGAEAGFGLFAYPVLMAADILLYDSDVVPVGKDQKQHLEFTRDWAMKFNIRFCPGYDAQHPEAGPMIFKSPEPLTRDATAVVPGRDGEKMSKTYRNTIDLFGTDKEVEKQIKSIKTDSTPSDAPKPKQQLLELLRLVLPEDEAADAERQWNEGGNPKFGYGHFKQRLLDGYHAAFDAARARYATYLADESAVERILAEGAGRARSIAAPVMSRVRAALGL